MRTVPTITVQQLAEALASTDAPQLLDVREDAEVHQSALPNIIHIPLNQLPDRLLELDPSIPVAVICRVGGRSAMATALLIQEGFTAANVAGGMLAWATEIDPSQPTP
jgi:rhodanese-related sulfurtransferase